MNVWTCQGDVKQTMLRYEKNQIDTLNAFGGAKLLPNVKQQFT